MESKFTYENILKVKYALCTTKLSIQTHKEVKNIKKKENSDPSPNQSLNPLQSELETA